jgi:hypothetical protein
MHLGSNRARRRLARGRTDRFAVHSSRQPRQSLPVEIVEISFGADTEVIVVLGQILGQGEAQVLFQPG